MKFIITATVVAKYPILYFGPVPTEYRLPHLGRVPKVWYPFTKDNSMVRGARQLPINRKKNFLDVANWQHFCRD